MCVSPLISPLGSMLGKKSPLPLISPAAAFITKLGRKKSAISETGALPAKAY